MGRYGGHFLLHVPSTSAVSFKIEVGEVVGALSAAVATFRRTKGEGEPLSPPVSSSCIRMGDTGLHRTAISLVMSTDCTPGKCTADMESRTPIAATLSSGNGM